MKVINPLENIDSEKISKIEQTINEYYCLSNKIEISKQKNLDLFQEYDIEKAIDEGLEINLMKLLDIEEPLTHSKEEKTLNNNNEEVQNEEDQI